MNNKEMIAQIRNLLDLLTENEPTAPEPARPVEMLTIKECAELISGLSEHTVRQLAAQDKAAHVRTGIGKRGKILVSKTSLLEYFGK